jgi:hypothetical protein
MEGGRVLHCATEAQKRESRASKERDHVVVGGRFAGKFQS